MESSQLRQAFLNFFKDRGHAVVPSDSLVPSGDPTLLFTSAGMVQFKKNFLGEAGSGFSRAASCQKCLRTSDIDQIGKTIRHLSFFEMLGNFSFGDYFKQDAIEWAWKFLTDEAGLDKKRLIVSVYKDDDEAFGIWKKIVPEAQICRLGADTNFWNMGTVGPCGPCSELLYDMGKEFSCGKKDCGPACDCDRYLEVWNLVFTQYDKQEDGSLNPLPKKNIDTGMGFERLLAVHKGVNSPFETDLFVPIINGLKETLNIRKEENVLSLMADHIRALVFMAGEGILPSNEGRGYVFRRLLRRAVREGRLLGAEKPFLYKLSHPVITKMKDAYDDLVPKIQNISAIVKTEEENFLKTLDSGLEKIKSLLKELKVKNEGVFPAEEAFKLFDTYGFPVEITREIAQENGLTIDIEKYNKLVEGSKETARRSWKGSGEKDTALYEKVLKGSGRSEFLGYSCCEKDALVKAVLSDGQELKKLKEGQEGEVVLDRTPFYPESGGQVGDKGVIAGGGSSAEVLDAAKPVEGLIVHIVKITKGSISAGDKVTARVEESYRRSTMRHHTATHLLHKALKEVLGGHVSQAGSFVSPGRLRFDYTHMKAPSAEQLDLVEEIVNKAIYSSMPVSVVETDIDKAKSCGAMALFGEKYGKKVRCVAVGGSLEDAYSLELCGGTHVNNTSDIGVFKILSDSSISSGVRRIEAVAGTEVLKYLKGLELKVDSWAAKLKSRPEEMDVRIEKMVQRVKSLEKENESLKEKLISGRTENPEEKIIESGGIKNYVDFIENADMKTLRSQSDILKNKVKSHMFALASSNSFVISLSQSGKEAGLDAGEIADDFAKAAGGKAGGRKDFAQGGGKITAEVLKDWMKKRFAK